MRKKRTQTTKAKIVAAAWKLFYEQGYEDTTVDDIVYESGTSKGSFYHYFEGKDALLETLSILFDEKYEELQGVAEAMDAVAALTFLNRELFTMIDNRIPLELLAEIDLEELSVQLKEELETATGQKRARLLKRLEVVESFRLLGFENTAVGLQNRSLLSVWTVL